MMWTILEQQMHFKSKHCKSLESISYKLIFSISSDCALLYNDRSVLENHHLTYSFKLLKQVRPHIYICTCAPNIA